MSSYWKSARAVLGVVCILTAEQVVTGVASAHSREAGSGRSDAYGLPARLTEATPPGQAESGYGSTENYIATDYETYSVGNGRDGSRVWYYVPDVLKNGANAPVVIFLHGWTAYEPSGYLHVLEHLIYQGYVVIFPQYQKGGAIGIMTDLNQEVFLERAIAAVDIAIDRLGTIADVSDVLVSGHSLGGLLSFCWNPAGGLPARAVLMNNGVLDSSEGIPPFVPYVPLDWQSYAPGITVPVMLLTGDNDQYNADTMVAYEALVNAGSRVAYMAISDSYGDPDIVANHTAVMAGEDPMTLDYRYYMAAFDAVLDRQDRVSFDLGTWSDGTPVTPVEQLTP